MKQRKLLSLLISSVMAFSAFSFVASAAEPAPKATIKATAYTATEAEALGVTVEDGQALYLLDIDLTDLGELSYLQSGTGLAAKQYGTKLAAVSCKMFGDNVRYLMLNDSKLPFEANSGNIAGGLKVEWLDTAKKTSYPTTVGTQYDNASLESMAQVYVTAPIGLTPTFDFQVEILTFDTTPNYTADNWYTVDVASFTFPDPNPTPVVKKLGLTIDGTDAKKENGYIWKLGLTQENGAQADSFTADFKDSTGLTNTKTARNEVSKFFGGEGTVEFYVGLKTARTITDFKATVADSTAEGVTASATWTAAE